MEAGCPLLGGSGSIVHTIKDTIGTSDKGHNRNNLQTKDKVQFTKWTIV